MNEQTPILPTEKSGWIGVDLDGTLAHYDGWHADGGIGEPIERMAARVRRWLAKGREVRIVTARAAYPDLFVRRALIEGVEQWTLKHFGQSLQVTASKDLFMLELWDDRAVQVIINTGIAVGNAHND